ncbi:MAG: M56 family metallopeptidase [Luteolibacter sp.]
MTSGFLLWLLLASLQACLLLPWVLFLTAFSKRMPAAWLSVVLSAGVILPILVPVLDRIIPGKVLAIPALERTGLFKPTLEVARTAQAEPLPPLDGNGSHGSLLQSRFRLAFGIWAAGAVLFAAGRWWQMLRERLSLGRGDPLPSDDPLWEHWRQLVRSLGLKRVPWLVLHDKVRTPLTLGWIDPVLVLPRFLHQFDPYHLDMLLRHEAEHLVRHDVGRRVMLEIIQAVFWFHPLFHFALKRYDLEVERACDDAVLRAGYPTRDYVELLLHNARVTGHGGRQLRQRVQALLQRERSRGWSGPKRLNAGYVLLFGLLILPVFALKIRPWDDHNTLRPLSPGRSPAAWWRCRMGHGEMVDDWSGHGLHGRLFGAKWVNDPERGVCLEFDGKNSILALPAPPDTHWSTGPFTVAMWLKPAPGSDGGGLLLRGEPNSAWSGARVHDFSGVMRDYGERELLLGGDIKKVHDGKLNTGLCPGLNIFSVIALRSQQPIEAGRWQHLAVVIEPVGDYILFSCYVDGRKIAEENFARNIVINGDWPTAWWWFGRGESPPVQGNYYEGRLSDLAVFPDALSPEDILRTMAGTPPTK